MNSAAAEPSVLVFDADCGFCTRAAGWLRQRSTGFAIAGYQTLDLDRFGVTEGQARAAALWIEPGGSILSGHDAIAAALVEARRPWSWVGRLIRLRPLRWLGRRIYPFVARHRGRLPGATDTCQAHRSMPSCDAQMNALVVIAHPDPSSFTHAAARAAIDGLRRNGTHVEIIDLYADGFRAAMTPDEHRAYSTDQPIIDQQIRRYADLVGEAEILVFCYPTWWSTMPAILKGWFDRTLVQGVAFRFDHRNRIRPAMTHVRRVVGISTYGSSRLYVKAINDNGRRLIGRTIRLNTGLWTRRTWLALYGMDTATAEQRDDFLRRIRTKAQRW